MGYDTTLFITHAYDEPGTKPQYRTYPDDDGKDVRYFSRPRASVIASVDLAVAGYRTATGLVLSKAREAQENTGWELFMQGAKDGSVPHRDLYGEKVASVPVDELLDALFADNAVEPYRRFTIALATIDAILATFKNERVLIFQWGH